MVGSHLLFHLIERGERVRAIYRGEASLDQVSRVLGYYAPDPTKLMAQVEWVPGDITDIGGLEPHFRGIRKVYHAAGLVSFDPRDKKELEKVNVQGTAHVVNLCLKHRVEKLCHISSISAIGPSKMGEMATEENEWTDSNLSAYGQSKWAGELEVWRASQEGLAMVILNPGVVMGPGFWEKGSGSILDYVAREEKYYIPGGTGYVGVNDLARAAIAAMDSPLVCERFIVVGQNLSHGELLGQVAEGLGVSPPTRKLPFFVLECLWPLEGMLRRWSRSKRKLSRALVKGLYVQERYSSEKIRGSLKIKLDGLDDEIRSSCSKFRAWKEGNPAPWNG